MLCYVVLYVSPCLTCILSLWFFYFCFRKHTVQILSDSLTVLTFPSARLSSFRSTAGESKRSCLASTCALKAARLTRVLVLKQKLGHHYAGPPERRSPTRASVGLNGLPEPCASNGAGFSLKSRESCRMEMRVAYHIQTFLCHYYLKKKKLPSSST